MPTKSQTPRTSGEPNLLLVGLFIFLFAVLLRVSLISTARFTDDEALFYQTTKHLVEGKEFPSLGPAISGGLARHPGPFFYWMMAPALAVSRAPEVANAWVGILGAVQVILFWLALLGPFGWAASTFAAVLMAASPWSVLYADRIWNANVSGLLVALCFWAAMKVRQKPSSWAIGPLIACAALLPQVHLPAPIIWVALFAMLWPELKSKKNHLNQAAILYGVIVCLVCYTPYLVFEIRSGFANARAYLAESGQVYYLHFWEVFLYAFRLLTLDTSYHELHGYWRTIPEPVSWLGVWAGTTIRPFSIFRLIPWVTSAVLALWMLRVWWKSRKLTEPAQAGLVAAFVLLAVTGKAFYPHYIQELLPFLWVGFAVLAASVWQNRRKRMLLLAMGAVFCLGGIESTQTISKQMDGRNGLATERQVLQAIHERTTATQDVTLHSTVMISPVAYNVLEQEVFQGSRNFRQGVSEGDFEFVPTVGESFPLNNAAQFFNENQACGVDRHQEIAVLLPNFRIYDCKKHQKPAKILTKS